MNIIFPLLWIFLGAVVGAAVHTLCRYTGWISFLIYVAAGVAAGCAGGYWASGETSIGYTLLAAAFAALLITGAMGLLCRALMKN